RCAGQAAGVRHRQRDLGGGVVVVQDGERLCPSDRASVLVGEVQIDGLLVALADGGPLDGERRADLRGRQRSALHEDRGLPALLRGRERGEVHTAQAGQANVAERAAYEARTLKILHEKAAFVARGPQRQAKKGRAAV